MNAVSGVTGYPVIQLMTLAETGTRALIGAVFGTTAIGELAWARRLLHLLDGSMLVLMDRGFDAGDFLAEVAATGAQFLVRLNATRRPPVLARLPDGSFTSVIGGVKVRVIAASVTITCHDGTRYGGEYRLATSLLDHRACPAGALISIYHERWEHETVYLALRHTLLRGRILRSGDPAGLEQEMWALLVYQALRTAVTDAVQAIAGTDPDRASYQVAVQAAQNLVTTARNITGPGDDLKGGIGRAVLASLNPPRRPRVCPRRVKSPLSRWNKHPPGKPTTSKQITSISTEIDPTDRKPATRRISKPAGQRADAGTCTLSSAPNVKPTQRAFADPCPRLVRRRGPVRGRPCRADGPPHRSLAPIPVRYTQGRLVKVCRRLSRAG